MKKTIIFGTGMFVALLFVGTLYFKNDMAMLFAAKTLPFQIIRLIVFCALGVLFFSRPPRALSFRLVIGAMSLGLVYLSIQQTFSAQLHLLDAVVFLETAVIFAIEALEEDSLAHFIMTPTTAIKALKLQSSRPVTRRS